ncbi:MAG: hypothetical protein J07HR59_01743 [Halorubrum sp. J07HR59]|nr:MAG: hypothetical protein J07HR59_01743 [Halorubrum sp. J07HR59]
MTVDMIGLFEDQEAARERFKQKHGEESQSYLFVCPDCEDEHPSHADNTSDKYGQIQ